MSAPIWQWSSTRTAQAIRQGDISSLEAARAHVDRAHAANTRLNAVVVDLSDEALAAAKEADAAQARGDALDLLHGAPITIKTNVDCKGQANSNGVAAMKDLIAPSGSPVARNLRRAGAIALGSTNTPEFPLRGVTGNPLHGRTLNPWDETVACGGSSGGAGSSLAADIGALAHGNDIGGSLRWPAHCKGVAASRPTLGPVAMFRRAADHLEAEGHVVEEIEAPDPMAGWQNRTDLLMGEVRLLQEKTLRPITSPDFNTALDAHFEFAEELDAAAYAMALADRTRIARNWMLTLEEHPAILAPVSVQRTVLAREDLDGPAREMDMWGNGGRCIGAIDHVGLPAAMAPAGPAHGHPVGVQPVASRYREDLALDAAEAVEKHAGMLVRQLWARAA